MIGFDFQTAGRIQFGAGVAGQLPVLLRTWGVRRCLLVQGAPEAVISMAARGLENAGIEGFPLRVGGEPSVADISAAVAMGRDKGCDGVAAVGGGSAIDTGKAAAALIANPGEVTDYLEAGATKVLQREGLPMAALPTTAGTGSEVTRNAVVSVPQRRVKISLRSPFLLPRAALVDPELTLSLPAAVTASTGMDALTQNLEALVSARANPMADIFARAGLESAVTWLERAWREPGNLEARSGMAFASLMGGLALANAGLGAAHGFAAVLGGYYPIAHGVICARMLPQVVQINVRELRKREPENPALAKYADIAPLFGVGGPEEIGPVLQSLVDRLEIQSLAFQGVSMINSEEIVAAARQASSMIANPIVLGERDLETIFRCSL